MSKDTNEEVYRILQSQEELQKINGEDLIKEAILSLPSKEDEEEEMDRRKISQYLNNVKEKALSDFVFSIRNKKIQEIKEELKNQLEKNNKNMYALITKSKIELEESEKKNKILIEEKKCLQNQITDLQNCIKELSAQMKDYEISLATLQNNYSKLFDQKNLVEEIKKNFSGETPAEIIEQLKIAKKGSTIMLESYTSMSQELSEMKKYQKDIDKKYGKKIDYLTNENDQLLNEKKENKEKYLKSMNELRNRMNYNQNKIKENDFLRNSLYHIYNILFDKLNLVRDIVIDEKYIGLSQKDFNPNVLYDPELISYIELMVKRMNKDSYDKMFRECVGYLNMLIRNYLPEKKKLRFKPVEIFREITNFIDLKVKSIEEYKNVIKHNKIDINNLQMNCNKLNEKYNNLVKEYESYKILVEKNIEKNNKEYLKGKKEKNKFSLNNYNYNYNFNYNPRINDIRNNDKDNQKSHLNLKRRNNIFNEDFKLSIDAESFGNKEIKEKKEKKTLLVKNVKKSHKKLLSAFKGNSVYNNYFNKIKNNCEKQINNIRPNSFDNEIMNKLIHIRKENKIKRNLNKDKLVKENGNQDNINNLNKINCLIDETNRLFLYKPRMASFQKKFNTIDCEEKIIFESPNINIKNNIDHKTHEHNLLKTYEGKIMKKLDGLINFSKVK